MIGQLHSECPLGCFQGCWNGGRLCIEKGNVADSGARGRMNRRHPAFQPWWKVCSHCHSFPSAQSIKKFAVLTHVPSPALALASS